MHGLVRPPPERSRTGGRGGLPSAGLPARHRSRRASRPTSGATTCAVHYWDRFDFTDTLFTVRADTLQMVEALCPLHCADLRPSDRRFADRLADAPCFLLAQDARLLLDARRAGAPRPQFAATQRRVLHPRVAGAVAEPVVRRIRTHRPAVRSGDGHAEPAGASGQRFPLYARLGRLGKRSTGCMPNTSCCSSTTPAVRCAARSARRSPRRRCSRR